MDLQHKHIFSSPFSQIVPVVVAVNPVAVVLDLNFDGMQIHGNANPTAIRVQRVENLEKKKESDLALTARSIARSFNLVN